MKNITVKAVLSQLLQRNKFSNKGNPREITMSPFKSFTIKLVRFVRPRNRAVRPLLRTRHPFLLLGLFDREKKTERPFCLLVRDNHTKGEFTLSLYTRRHFLLLGSIRP